MEDKSIKKATKIIKKFEGLSLKPYYCSSNVKTIGWGHVITKNDKIGASITNERAEELLKQDIANAASCLFRNSLGISLNYNQKAALISFIFNLGGSAFQRSVLRQKLLRGEYTEAAKEFSRWVFVGSKKLKGLEKRRLAEKELFETPIKNKIVYPAMLSKIKDYIFNHAKA